MNNKIKYDIKLFNFYLKIFLKSYYLKTNEIDFILYNY